MKGKLLLCLLISCFFITGKGFSQTTTAGYNFSAFSSTYASVSGSGSSTISIGSFGSVSTSISIGFNFVYCGTTYTTLSMSTDGWVSLANSSLATYPCYWPTATSLTSIAGGAGLLFPYWLDLYGGSSSAAYTRLTGTSPNRVFTIEWNNWSSYYSGGNANFQVKLYETTNVIDFCYGSASWTAYAGSIGIANSSTDYRTLSDATTSPSVSSSPSGTFYLGMISPSSGQVYRWTPCPITVTATNSGIACPGDTVTLTGTTSASTYSWTGPAGFTSTSLTPYVVPSAPGGYTLSGSNGVCTNTATTFISTYPTPPTPILTPSAVAVCNGGSVLITATVPTLSATAPIIAQDFNSGLGGWTITNLSGTATTYWQIRTPPAYAGLSGDGTPMMEAAPDAYVYALTSTLFTSPGFSTVGYTAATLTFNQDLVSYTWATVGWGDNIVAVQYSIDGGSTWTTFLDQNGVYMYITSWTAASPQVTVALPVPTIGQPNVKIRWNYNSFWGFWWAVDNIKVTGTPVTAFSPTWSPSTYLYQDAALTVPYTTGTHTYSVEVHADTITVPTVMVYTATVTSSGGCHTQATSTVTINPSVPPITGVMSACTGYTTTLHDTIAGGTWSTLSTGVATVSPTTGIVTGLAPGTATVVYTVAGCSASAVVTVTAFPLPITGIMIACLGSTTSLFNSLPGGTWSSSDPTKASVVATTGVVTGNALGTATITYSMGSGCQVTTVITVNPFPNAISGSPNVCIGATTPFSSTTPGGVWTSSAPATAGVGVVSGVVTGLSLGTATISYRVAGCSATKIVTVVSAATPIIGPSTVCMTYPTITLTDGVTGGTWSSGSPGVASIGSSTGVVTGNLAGTAIITYAIGSSCLSKDTITVLPPPDTTGGTPSVCQGSTTTLTHTIPGGTWTSDGPGFLPIGLGSGIVTGVVTGSTTAATATITYTIPSGCITTRVVTLDPAPLPIGGTLYACQGGTSALTNTTTGGGTWSSSNPFTAAIDATGLVSGMATGTATITFTASTGCITTAIFTVNGIPSAITGPNTVCVGSCVPELSGSGGGAWATSDPTIATVSGAGSVCGVTVNTVTISYILATGCQTTKVVTVTPGALPIIGNFGICVGNSTTLSDGTTGGGWTSSAPSIAPVGALSGIVTGLATGTATITYTAPSGCFVTATVTVNTVPGVIGGTLGVCAGQTTTLTNSVPGGMWSGTPLIHGTIDPTTGVFSGIAAGTTLVTYSLGTCSVTATVTTNPLPTAITGNLNICACATSALGSTPGGGTWNSSILSVVGVGIGTGIITGSCGLTTTGTSTISYILAPSGCVTSAVVTVNPLPGAITGTFNLCVGNTTTLSTTTPGATWTSSVPGVATIGVTTGIVTGIAGGTTTITVYGTGGCTRTQVITVNALPTPIGGPTQVCAGLTVTMTSTPAGGTWSTTPSANASVIPTTGVVTGLVGGTTASVIYTSGTGCTATKTITINALPAAITGAQTLCVGTTTTLNSTTTGGTWSSGNTIVATVGAGTGVVNGISAGAGSATAPITYTLSTGCIRAATVTVYALPTTITGPLALCANQTATLNSTPAGGAWSSGSPAVGTIDPSTGAVTGMAPGTSMITYTVGTGCQVTAVLTVNPVPTPISGGLGVCVGQTTTLGSTPTGYTWSASGTGTPATINASTGVVSGGTAGTSGVTYTLPTGCRATATVTVYALPAAIGGSLNVCLGQTTALSNTSTGGTWASSIPANGTVDVTTGIVTGINTGTTTITYSLGTGCIKTADVTVNPLPANITGITNVCVGLTTTLNSTTAGGTWSSSTTSVATINASGVATGMTAGTSTITYMLPTGCIATTVLTVNPPPGGISGTMTVCENSTTTLSAIPTGGAWSIAGTNASVVAGTGVVTGITAGTALVTYTIGTGCQATTPVTINPLPAVITGNPGVCIGLTTTLANTSIGGTWSSSNTAIAPVDISGIVTGAAIGNANIIYTLPVTGCTRTVQATVNPLPAPITGPSGFCNLSVANYLSATPPPLTWTSLTPSKLTINPSTGAATGVDTGLGTITVATAAGCTASKTVTIILAPYPISGDSMLCIGQTTALGNTITGGTWTSSTPTIGSVDVSTGVAMGLTLGIANINYQLSSGCSSNYPVTVNPSPGAIGGQLGACVGLTATVTNSLIGGSWYSSNTTVASVVPSTGLVTGNSQGTTIITYLMPSGCMTTAIFTVNGLPGPINGNPSICQGSSTTLSNDSTGGTWNSGTPVVAYTSGTTGIVYGSDLGTATITYTLGTGCIATKDVTVNFVPQPIAGAHSVCQYDSIFLTDPTPGGMWSSSNPTRAVVAGNPVCVVTGANAGTVIISYTMPSGCAATMLFTVNGVPANIQGSLAVCAGFATNLIDSTPGGTWSADPLAAGVGTIHHLTGVVTGITPGTVNVTYTLGTGCKTNNTVTVILLPAVISGTPQVCVLGTTTLSNPIPGGTWSSSNANATVDVASGVVTGVAAGPATITYMVGTGCFNVLHITVNPLPAPLTGPSQVCQNASITLATATTGAGTWSSSSLPTATVNSTGVVTGVAAGTTFITYTISATNCEISKEVTVNVAPPAIVGNGYICQESTVPLTDAMTGGVWSSSNPSVAAITTVTATIPTAVVTPVTLGIATISYTLPVTGCQATKMVTVSPLPVVYNVTGGGTYCAGGNGVPVGLTGSQTGVSYALYDGPLATGYLAGSGLPLNFGLETPAGIYTVLATYAMSGCKRAMAGNADVIITPLTPPVVTLNTGTTDNTSCPGIPVTITPVPTNGGTAPTYTWKVNGLTVSTANTYNYIPANGDVVTVRMTSNGNCISTSTATGSATMTVLPSAIPAVGIAATPGDTVCQYAVVTFNANAQYGGPSPVYRWFVNGADAGTGATYSYAPVQGDRVSVRMVSDYKCRLADSVMSNDVPLTVDSMIIPHVDVVNDTAANGLATTSGRDVTLKAVATNAGPHPMYQWQVNSVAIPGATNELFTHQYNDYDSVTCMVTSSGVCHNIGTFNWVYLSVWATGVQQVAGASDIALLPNPNRGLFTVRGTLGSTADETLSLEVTDMLGQVVYHSNVQAVQGKINGQVQLTGTLANGMYILSLKSSAETKTFHFVIEE